MAQRICSKCGHYYTDEEHDCRPSVLEQLRMAVGLFTTAKPDMVMDPDDPIQMALEVVAYVESLRAEIDRLREALDEIATTAVDCDGHRDAENLMKLVSELETVARRALRAPVRLTKLSEGNPTDTEGGEG